MDGETAIGRMYEVDTPLGKQWGWSVYGLVLDGYPPAGMADSWEAAMNAQGGLGGGREEVGDRRPHGAVPAMGRAWGLAGNDTRNVKTIGGVSLFQI